MPTDDPQNPGTAEQSENPGAVEPVGFLTPPPIEAAAPPADEPSAAEVEAAGAAEAFRAQVEEVQQDPWAILRIVQDFDAGSRLRTIQARQSVMPLFFDSAARREYAVERDALLSQGRILFGYSMETARNEIEQRQEEGVGSETQTAPFVATDDHLVEAIWCPATSAVKYIRFGPNGIEIDPETGQPELKDEVLKGEIIFRPPHKQMVELGTVILPTGVEEYGDEPTLYRDIRHFISCYLFIPDREFLSTIAYYVMFTWVFDKFPVTPYLRAIGDYGTGKSRLLQVTGALVYRAMRAGGATTAAPLFRIITEYKGTLILDEADFAESDLWSETIKILNQGYDVDGGPVLRAERMGGENSAFGVKAYSTFGPKVIATRKNFQDPALESRCLSHTMPRIPEHNLPAHIPSSLDQEFRMAAASLRNKLLLWRFRRYRQVAYNPRERFTGLDLRLIQVIQPILACVEDTRMKDAILSNIRQQQAVLAEERRESIEGVIAEAVVNRWWHHKARTQEAENRQARSEGREPRQVGIERIVLSEITEMVNRTVRDSGGSLIEPRKIGDIVRRTFRLHTQKRGGVIFLHATDEAVEDLARGYNLDAQRRPVRGDGQPAPAPQASPAPAAPVPAAPAGP